MLNGAPQKKHRQPDLFGSKFSLGFVCLLLRPSKNSLLKRSDNKTWLLVDRSIMVHARKNIFAGHSHAPRAHNVYTTSASLAALCYRHPREAVSISRLGLTLGTTTSYCTPQPDARAAAGRSHVGYCTMYVRYIVWSRSWWSRWVVTCLHSGTRDGGYDNQLDLALIGQGASLAQENC